VSGTERFATALTCIDGRIHATVVAWIRRRLSVEHVDLVTAQGPDLVLAHGDDAWVSRLAESVGVSQRAHASTTLVIASHSECAAHPVPDPVHHDDLQKAVARFGPLCPGMELLTVHLGRSEGGWEVVESGAVRREAAR
jgi:hypothetical protein